MSLGTNTGGRDATKSNDAGGLGPMLGLLTSLPGTWVGTGFNVIALPDFQGGKKFRLMLNALKETTEFKDIGAPIPNRGNTQGDIEYKGLHDLQ